MPPLTPDGIDQSWGYANPAAAFKAGIRVVSMYLSRDKSKNVTAAKVKAYHAVGIGVLLNWEGVAGAPLKGAPQGKLDAADAVAQARALIKAVGYAPKSKLTLAFSCDRDTTSASYPMVDAYYAATKAIVHSAAFWNGVYGEFDLVGHLHAAGLTDMEWQTYAWSGGRLSPEADFYQFHNGQTLGGASVDFDKIEHAAQLGAWWPPNHPLNTTGAPPMTLTAADLAAMKTTVTAANKPIVDELAAMRELLFTGHDGGQHHSEIIAIMATGKTTAQAHAEWVALKAKEPKTK